MIILDNKEAYTLKEVCELLNEKEYNIRYEEKIMGLNLLTDDKNNKYYSKENLELLQFLKEYKTKGLELKTIKMAMEGNIIKFAKEDIENKEIIEQTDEKNYKNDIANIHTEKIISKENGNISEITRYLMSGMSIDVFKKMVQVEQNIEILHDDMEKQYKKLNYKIDKSIEKSTKDIINDNKNNAKELSHKMDNMDSKLINNLLTKIQEDKKKAHKDSLFKRIFK